VRLTPDVSGYPRRYSDGSFGASKDRRREDPANSQLTIAYLNAGQPGRLVTTATVRKRGKDLLVCEADVVLGDTARVHAVATFALVR
jgi:acyl-coenzyme A thioesterase PaaI-like protein